MTEATAVEPWPLNARERSVLQLLIQGHGNKAIALRMECAEVTVKNYLTGIIKKMGVASGASARLRVALMYDRWVRQQP